MFTGYGFGTNKGEPTIVQLHLFYETAEHEQGKKTIFYHEFSLILRINVSRSQPNFCSLVPYAFLFLDRLQTFVFAESPQHVYAIRIPYLFSATLYSEHQTLEVI